MRIAFHLTLCFALAGLNLYAEEGEAEHRARAIKHFQAIGRALHAFHDAKKALPQGASQDKEGKALLSWRVHLLPFLDEHERFAEFHLDEPWDSEHNKKLIPKMPDVYVNPRAGKLDAGLTSFQVPIAPGTAFEAGRMVRFQDILDGTANTVMVVEVDAKHAVEWTRPADVPWDRAKPERPLLWDSRDRTLSLFVSGDVVELRAALGPPVLRSYFLRDDGEAVEGAVIVKEREHGGK